RLAIVIDDAEPAGAEAPAPAHEEAARTAAFRREAALARARPAAEVHAAARCIRRSQQPAAAHAAFDRRHRAGRAGGAAGEPECSKDASGDSDDGHEHPVPLRKRIEMEN